MTHKWRQRIFEHGCFSSLTDLVVLQGWDRNSIDGCARESRQLSMALRAKLDILVPVL